jgi:hypothetical protein
VRKAAILCLLSSGALFAQTKVVASQSQTQAGSGRTRHLFSRTGALTPASAAPAQEIAEKFVRRAAAEQGLRPEDLSGLYVARSYRTQHNGVTHFVFRQRFDDVDSQNAEWTVNIDPDGRVINGGGRLVRRPQMPAPDINSAGTALRTAIAAESSRTASSYLAGRPGKDKYVRFVRGGFGDELEGKPVWYSVADELRSAWVFYIPNENGSDIRATVVDAQTQRILKKYSLARFQAAAPVRGLVFERSSPQPNPRPGTLPDAPPPYVERTLRLFAGDPVASPKGWVESTRTTGNNVMAGHNPLGDIQSTQPTPAESSGRDFSFPLELGPGAPNPTSFKDAATTNLFYWINRAHDLFYALGFDEEAGNFQQDNFGRGGVGGDPVLAFSQFGVAANDRAMLDNAFFLTNRDQEDGSRISVNMFLSGSRPDRTFSDGSYDNEVILHEYTHGVSDRLVRQLRSLQGDAMSEGWSDFFALEFLLPEGSPVDGVYPIGEYLTQSFGTGIRTRPYSTNMQVNPLTYAELGRVQASGPEVHDDGEIWMQALWEARASLIRQLGEAEGRRRMRVLVLDGMKLSPPAPSMIDARDSILLADRVNFKGESQAQLWQAFAKRGLGVLAQSDSAESVHVSPSFEIPSNAARLSFYDSDITIGERIRVALHDADNTSPTALVQLTSSSGDLENLLLRKEGDVYYGWIESWTDGFVNKGDSALDLVPGDYVSAYYVDYDTGSGSSLVQTTASTRGEYTMSPVRSPPFVSGVERPLFTIISGGRAVLESTRVTLPFAFPFFGEKYRTVHVAGDGLLAFGVPNFTACNDPASASKVAGVFPMWMELAYNGRAQNNENVFYSEGPGTVTFRWAAETIQTGEPVNFSAVLFEDGRIQFQYGAGNNNLVNSAVFGCSTNAPVVGISNGRESYVKLHGEYSGAPFLAQAPSVLIEPPSGYASVPVVQLESPVAGERYRGVITIRGIAYDADAAVARLDVLVDGVPRRLLRPEIPRADYCAANPVRGCPTVGFFTALDLQTLGLAPGPHTIQIQATNTRGAFRRYPEQPVSVTVEAGQSRQPVGQIETPSAGAAISGSTPVRGYVYAEDLRIVSVDVIVDGVTYGQAVYGQRRDDVCGAVSGRPPNCPNAGFTFNLNSLSGSVQLPNGKHLLQARAQDESGRLTLFPSVPIEIVVQNEENQAPTGILVSPAPGAQLAGTVKIWGWAYDLDGRVASAELVVDGSVYMRLEYGEERAEQCAGMAGVAACPNIGFWGDFDTTTLANGVHSMGVRIRDDKGRTRLIPGLIALGMNVTVQN